MTPELLCSPDGDGHYVLYPRDYDMSTQITICTFGQNDSCASIFVTTGLNNVMGMAALRHPVRIHDIPAGKTGRSRLAREIRRVLQMYPFATIHAHGTIMELAKRANLWSIVA